MEKKKVKKAPKPTALSSFRDVKFNLSFITVLLAGLILLLSFMIYNKYSIETPPEEYEEITEEEPTLLGDDCVTNSDCPQPRCMGMASFCENGYCIVRQTSPSAAAARCIDLKTPVCGNAICEADEKDKCPEDC